MADAFGAPLHYVRGNHDVGSAWAQAERGLLPGPMPEATVVVEAGLGPHRLLGLTGVQPPRDTRCGAGTMWRRAFAGWMRARSSGPLVVVSHAPPRGLNDAADLDASWLHRLPLARRRLAPPIWLHGHTALVRRGLDARCARHGPTLLYNCTGATLVELVPAAAGARAWMRASRFGRP